MVGRHEALIAGLTSDADCFRQTPPNFCIMMFGHKLVLWFLILLVLCHLWLSEVSAIEPPGALVSNPFCVRISSTTHLQNLLEHKCKALRLIQHLFSTTANTPLTSETVE